MPNVTRHPGAAVFPIESYEPSKSRNEKARFKHRGVASCRGKRKLRAWKGDGRLKDWG
jgi:hypothetical protein